MGKGGCEKAGGQPHRTPVIRKPPSHCRPYIRSQPTTCIRLTASEWSIHQTTQLMGDTLNPDQVLFVVRFDVNGWINYSAVSSLTPGTVSCTVIIMHVTGIMVIFTFSSPFDCSAHYAMVITRPGWRVPYKLYSASVISILVFRLDLIGRRRPTGG